MSNSEIKNSIRISIAPWITVSNAETAAGFYKNAFDAKETYRLETPDGGRVLRLAVGVAEFWLSSDSGTKENKGTENVGADTIRMILTVADPDSVFAKAIHAGAKEIFPVGEDYGWRLGRIVDPFGLHWEIGYQLSEQ